MRIVDALDEGGLLNYWGLSYGTALGATVAAMFPDKMGKVVLDGCLYPHDYYAGNDVEQLTNTDASFDGFSTGCVAHPEVCVLAQHATTAKELKAKFYDLLYTIKYEPFVIRDGNPTSIITYNALKGFVQGAIYGPSTWPTLAMGLHGLLTSNATAALALKPLMPGQASTIYPNNGVDASFGGIRASDVIVRTNLTSIYPLIQKFFAKSQLLGDVFSLNLLTYVQWPFKAKGGYKGDFHVKTRNPILLIGSDVDPVTPLVSARNASAGFEGSVVLQHGGYGVSPAPGNFLLLLSIFELDKYQLTFCAHFSIPHWANPHFAPPKPFELTWSMVLCLLPTRSANPPLAGSPMPLLSRSLRQSRISLNGRRTTMTR